MNIMSENNESEIEKTVRPGKIMDQFPPDMRG